MFDYATLNDFFTELIFLQKILGRFKGIWHISFFGFSLRTFEVIVVFVVKFFVACLVSEILKDKLH